MLAEGWISEEPIPDHSPHPKPVHDFAGQDAQAICCLLDLKAPLATLAGVIDVTAVLLRLKMGKPLAVVDAHVDLHTHSSSTVNATCIVFALRARTAYQQNQEGGGLTGTPAGVSLVTTADCSAAKL